MIKVTHYKYLIGDPQISRHDLKGLICDIKVVEKASYPVITKKDKHFLLKFNVYDDNHNKNDDNTYLNRLIETWCSNHNMKHLEENVELYEMSYKSSKCPNCGNFIRNITTCKTCFSSKTINSVDPVSVDVLEPYNYTKKSK